MLGKIFNKITYYILGLNYNDTQCGFKLFSAIKIKEIIRLCKVGKFCIDVEILYLAKIKNFKVFETGIIWNDKNLKIKWPIKKPKLSQKDKKNISFKNYLKNYE